MGVAAQNVGGNTLHLALSLGHNRSTSNHRCDNSDLVHMWDRVNYLLVDEISMVGAQLLENVNYALCSAKGNNLPFGKVNVIFIGDFTQLPPVGQHLLVTQILTLHVTDLKTQCQIFGKLLWYSVDMVVLLTEVERQSGTKNSRFVDLLAHL